MGGIPRPKPCFGDGCVSCGAVNGAKRWKSKDGKLRCDMKSFIEKCLEGGVLFSEIHDYIEQWHESADIDVPLNEYLGMTQEEYDLFVMDEKNLGYIFYSRRHKVSLDSVLKGDTGLQHKGEAYKAN